jgi:hypothetical protein
VFAGRFTFTFVVEHYIIVDFSVGVLHFRTQVFLTSVWRPPQQVHPPETLRKNSLRNFQILWVTRISKLGNVVYSIGVRRGLQ